jgi:hypothetical protein
MTATLDPGPYADAVKRIDLRSRADDYAHALQFWAAHPDSRIKGIVFCENSSIDPQSAVGPIEVGSDFDRKIEWLGFTGNTRPKGMHYGYSELGTIDHAMSHSRLLAETALFLKVTGRLTFPRVSRLLDTFDDETRFAADCRRAYRGESGAPIRVRTEIMLIDREFYRHHLYQRRDEMLTRCSHIEEFIAVKVLPLESHRDVMLRFRTECPPVGIGAHNGTTYQTVRRSFKSTLRHALRKVAPGIWL